MLYKHRTDPLQLRHRCRNPRCAGNFKILAANPRDAFCCKGCEKQFYCRRCRVCEDLFSPKTSRKKVCQKAKCQSAFWRHPEDFFGKRYPNLPVRYNGARSPHSTGLKSDAKTARGWCVAAGPEVHPINLRSFPADAAVSRAGRPGPVLITRNTPPVNIIGGYRFPGAPAINLRQARAAPPVLAIQTDDESGIPEFLKRTHDAARVPA